MKVTAKKMTKRMRKSARMLSDGPNAMVLRSLKFGKGFKDSRGTQYIGGNWVTSGGRNLQLPIVRG